MKEQALIDTFKTTHRHTVDKSEVLLIMFALIIDTVPLEEAIEKERMKP